MGNIPQTTGAPGYFQALKGTESVLWEPELLNV